MELDEHSILVAGTTTVEALGWTSVPAKDEGEIDRRLELGHC